MIGEMWHSTSQLVDHRDMLQQSLPCTASGQILPVVEENSLPGVAPNCSCCLVSLLANYGTNVTFEIPLLSEEFAVLAISEQDAALLIGCTFLMRFE